MKRKSPRLAQFPIDWVPNYIIGGYAKLSREKYKELLKELDCGFFHIAQGTWGFTVKVINEEIRQALIKIHKTM